MKNFDHPYFARSISEFWRRWHISLSTWFRDYLYIPLGGSRVTKPRWIFNILITFLISGLWHGANWTYIIWGGLHGLYFVASDVTSSLWKKFLPASKHEASPRFKSAISTLTTFSITTFAWIFFRADSLSDAAYITTHLHSTWRTFLKQFWNTMIEGLQQTPIDGPYAAANAFFNAITPITNETRSFILITLLILLILLSIELMQFNGNLLERLNKRPPIVRQLIYASLITITLVLGSSYISEQQAFIYFQF